jgi:hypothetical protein
MPKRHDDKPRDDLTLAFLATLPPKQNDIVRLLLKRETAIMKDIKAALLLPVATIKQYPYKVYENPRRGVSFVFSRSVIVRMAAEHNGAVGLLDRRKKRASRLEKRRTNMSSGRYH